jgi:peptide-methionine (R)-S-oxide reductase
MRIPSLPTILRTIYTFTTTATRLQPSIPRTALLPFTRGTILKSMPTFPFLGSLFSSDSTKMSFPVQKSDDEWRAVLNKGTFPPPLIFHYQFAH